MRDPSEIRRRTFAAAREIAHAATALASEAAGLARLYELHGSLETSITASHASIDAAQAAFKLDESARTGGSDLLLALQNAESALGSAERAIGCARRALSSAAASLAGSAASADG